ncbi:MAG: hypothetical protein MI725_15745 [Pirellulales bacterium]|nr:hypothetical protein [Pirellulales bacterium]
MFPTIRHPIRLIVVVVSWIYFTHVHADQLYWANIVVPGAVFRSNLDGTDVTTVATNLGSPRGLAVDATAGRIYWTDFAFDGIRSMNLNGTDITDVVTGLDDPLQVAFDGAGKIYWTTTGKIQRANLDGTLVEDVVTGLEFPQALTIDLAGNNIYWTEDKPSGGPINDRIRRAAIPASCCSTAVDVVTGLDNPHGIQLDVANGRIYWVEEPNGEGLLRRANIDGSSVETLVEPDVNYHFDDPIDLVLDVDSNFMYWGDLAGQGKISRSDLSGNSIVDVVSTNPVALDGVVGLAIGPNPIPEPSTFTIAFLLTLVLCVFQPRAEPALPLAKSSSKQGRTSAQERDLLPS